MCVYSFARRIGLASCLFAGILCNAGCEGIDRRHDTRVGSVDPPPEDAEVRPASTTPVNYPDMVETMMTARQQYVKTLLELERAYLDGGDSHKADWARRQRDQTEAVLVYPYLSTEAPEYRVQVAPEEQIAEADAIYDKALGILNEVRAIPLAGALTHNKRKAREALEMFKKILKDYPKSDKVDDSAYYCGEIYKEYLREDDPNDELSVRYYKWAVQLDPKTPHAARFQCAVVYDFRKHDRAKALQLYHQVLDLEENKNSSNCRFSATRIEQLSDEDFSHLRPEEPRKRPAPPEPKVEDPNYREGKEPVSTAVPKSRTPDDSPLEPETVP